MPGLLKIDTNKDGGSDSDNDGANNIHILRVLSECSRASTMRIENFAITRQEQNNEGLRVSSLHTFHLYFG